MREAQDPQHPPKVSAALIPPRLATLSKKVLAKKPTLTTIFAQSPPQQQLALPPLMDKLRKSQQQLLDWQSEGNDFIPLFGCYDAGYQGALVLEEEVTKFLSDQSKKVLLLTGHSGAGKSLFTQGFISKLWEDYQEGDPIPLWISLPNCKQPETKAIEESLLNCGFDHEQIEILRKTQRFNFIFDAYDEIRCLKNLWVSNKLALWNASSIFTCRHEYLYWMENFKNLFTPISDDRLDYAALDVVYIKPFCPEQIEDYVKHYIKKHDTLWKQWEDYQRGFEEIPGLKELIQTPYVLKLAVEALPNIMKCYDSVESIKKKELTKAVLYDVFVEQWFSRQERKLKDSGIISENESIQDQFWDYAKSLARLMHEQQVSQVLYEPTEADIFDIDAKTADENPFSPFFDPSRPRVQLLQTSCLVRQTGVNLFAFAHASLLDYFVTKDAVFLNDSQQNPRSDYQQKEEPINASLFTETQVNLLAERVKESEAIKKALLDWVYSSRNNPETATAAANAITILVKAGITFNGADLPYLYLGKANISGGYFDSANFEGTDLHNVKMHRTWLRQANLRRCNLKDIDFGEYPWIELEAPVNRIIYREDLNQLLATCNGKIFIWNLKTKRIYKEMNSPKHIRDISMSQNGELIVFSADRNSYVYLLNVKTGRILKWGSNRQAKKPSWVHNVCISADGKTVAYEDDGMVILWDISSGKPKLIREVDFLHRAKERWCIEIHPAISAEGKFIAGISNKGDNNDLVSAWEIESNKEIVLRGHVSSISSVVINAKGTIVVSGDCSGAVHVWDLTSGQSKVFMGTRDIDKISLSCDERFLAVSAHNTSPTLIRSAMAELHDFTVSVLDFSSGNFKDFYGHDCFVNAVAISRDTRRIVSGSDDKTIRFWNFDASSRGLALKCHEVFVSMNFINGKKLMIVSRTNSDILLRDINGIIKSYPIVLGSLPRLFISKNGDSLVYEGYSVDQDNTTRINAKTLVLDLVNDETKIFTEYSLVDIFCVNKNGRKVVMGSYDIIRIWDVVKGEIIKWKEGMGSVNSIFWSLDEKLIVCSVSGGKVLLWDIEKMTLDILYEHNKDVYCLCISEDNELVVSGGYYDMKVIAYNIRTGKKIELTGHLSSVTSVCISMDRTHIISSGKDKTIRFWDINSVSENKIIYLTKPIKEISINDSCNSLAIRLEDSIQLWVRINEYGSVWQLKWSSNFSDHNDILNLAEMDTRDSRGLSWDNQLLLSQRKAILNNNRDSSSTNKIGSTLLSVSKLNRSPIYMGQHRPNLATSSNPNPKPIHMDQPQADLVTVSKLNRSTIHMDQYQANIDNPTQDDSPENGSDNRSQIKQEGRCVIF